jgi:hypothetical protein
MRTILTAGALVLLASCGGSSSGDNDANDGAGDGGIDAPTDATSTVCVGVTCDGHGTCVDVAGAAICQCDGGYVRTAPTSCELATGPTIAGCPQLPADHLFNTAIDTLPVHPMSGAFITTIGGARRLHLDLGVQTDQQAADYYGVPYNLVHGAALAWPTIAYFSADPDLDWNTRAESDCAVGAAHTFTQPCTAGAAPNPQLPIPPGALVEGGINAAADQQPYGDHHVLLIDADACRLWEGYHVYSPSAGVWNTFGSAGFDLRSNALRPADWSSADAAGFPMFPLLLRADEASSGTIRHALRFTITSSKIRIGYVWPARHQTVNGTTSANLPPMGQLFRLKASFAIPTNYSVQAKAILQAMKTYGMYIADGGSDMFITGDPSAAWDDATFSQVQLVTASNFEAVDLTPIMARAGWSADSARVP